MENDREWVASVIEKIREKMLWVREKSADKIPYTTVNGTHDDKSDGRQYAVDDGLQWWCNGFWGGMMWMMYHDTGDGRYLEIARRSEEKLDQCFLNFNGLHHDVGFMWLPTAVADYRLTGNEKARTRGLHAATLLAGRFNPAGNFIRAWNGLGWNGGDNRGWAIIDCMFNIALLYWAGEITGDPRFAQIAMRHADTVMGSFVREDGSVRHIVEFDAEKGGMVREYGGQGCGLGSSWTRGQAWGLYGFLMSYRHTGRQEYLDTAEKIAGYFISRIPEDGLIPVDFCQPEEPDWHDDSAAAIASCGLLEIAKATGKPEGVKYYEAAVKLLQALDREHCCWGRESDCIVQKCSGAYNSPVHEFPLIYGDFFFLEAMFKLKGGDIFLW